MTASLSRISRGFSCEAPWTKLSTGCFRFHEKKMSQDEARRFCENFNSHLVEINSEEENTAILAEIGRKGFPSRHIEFWLGITDRDSEGNWVLESNRESLPFLNWEPNQPD